MPKDLNSKLILLGLAGAITGSFIVYLYRSKKAKTQLSSKSIGLSCIIKLGGSACTIKDSFETLNQGSIDSFGEQLQDILSKDPEFRPVVIHGAGSFGHFHARRFSVSCGTNSETGKPEYPGERISAFLRSGFARTRISVSFLNYSIVQTLNDKGVPAVSVHPFPFIPIVNRSMSSLAWPWEAVLCASLLETLSLGLVPVLHGDACIDTSEQGTGILSGDTLLVYLCKLYRPSYAVFLADVEGILTAPPGSTPEPRLIREILVQSSGNWTVTGNQSFETSVSSHDVTGGIVRKIESAVSVVRDTGIPLFIVKAGTEDAKRAMMGELPERGTVIRFES
jgi:isopentenyl phosphate kinase